MESLDQLMTIERDLLSQLVGIRQRQAIVLREQRDAVFADGLTPSELNILQLVRSQMQNKEIAQRLGITVRTVKFHITNLLRKFDVDERNKL